MKTMKPIVAAVLLLAALFAKQASGQMMKETDLTLKTATGEIFGTLMLPEKPTDIPVVLIIAGSGPTDRDCNSSMGIKTNAYKMLAECLAGQGIASLRYDKRGIAQSKAAMTAEADLRFETYINDAVDWLKMLKADKRFNKLIVLGHSEGSLIGMVATSQAEASAFISLSGAGEAADIILKKQLKDKLPPALLEESDRILESLKAGKTDDQVSPSLNTLYRPSVQPYMISWMKYDPAKEIAKLKVPALIVQGTTDLQVTVEDAKLLSGAKPDAKLVIVENMNHVLKESGPDLQENMGTYTNPELPLKKELGDEVTNFVKLLK